MNNSISFFLPSVKLRGFIQNYYICEFYSNPDSKTFEQTHIPNGSVEMFIGYQDTRSTCFNRNGDLFITDTGIVGAHNLGNAIKGLALEPGGKELKFISVNFTQNGFYNIFKIPGPETYNGLFNGKLILGNEILILQEKLSLVKTNLERITLLESYLLKKLIENIDKQFNLYLGFNIASYISCKMGNVRLKELMAEFRTSDRTLQRAFKASTGYPIKEYCKILRFYNLLEKISSQNDIIWADMVSQCGYYDQPHLINEFRSATGLSPTVYSRNMNNNIFRLYNHLVILKSVELYDTMIEGSRSSLNVTSSKSNAL
jgi:AraC-like DNA-binding protein